jgi:hypothetical protein
MKHQRVGHARSEDHRLEEEQHVFLKTATQERRSTVATERAAVEGDGGVVANPLAGARVPLAGGRAAAERISCGALAWRLCGGPFPELRR